MSSIIECEIRSFVDNNKFNELVDLFTREGKFVGEDYQVTYYFDCDQDLRIQLNDSGSKLWLKLGSMHDDAREEIEVKCARGDFANLEKLFIALGYNIETKWFRKRRRFQWRGIKVTLDETEGYGRIIELERLATEATQDETLVELRKFMTELRITPTPREEFDRRYQHYKDHWRDLVQAQLITQS